MEEAVDSRDAVGASCSDAYVPLQDDDKVSEFALDGLKQVMAVKSRVVLPYLVPKVHFHMQHMPKLGPPVCAQCRVWQGVREQVLGRVGEWAPLALLPRN